MTPTAHVLRIGKIVAVTGIGLLSLLVTLGNITDYCSNFLFVEHVMKMDTIFPASNIHNRSFHSPVVFTCCYVCIITLEAFMAFACLRGSWDMTRNLKSGAVAFHTAKRWALWGLTGGILLWFIGFEVVGGEWFGMWQSTQWNGLYSADRIVTFIMLVFISLQLKEEERPEAL